MGAAKANVLGTTVFISCLWVLQHYLGMLEFDRQQILSGEVWRIWTGHLVHTNNAHFLLNSVAAIILYFAFFTKIKLSELLLFGFVFASLISVTLLCLYPYLDWYNGLSGLLHALVAYFSMLLAKNEDKMFWAGLAIVWAKVLFEATRASLGYKNMLGDMTVIIDAHFIGVFFGTIIAFICMMDWREKGENC